MAKLIILIIVVVNLFASTAEANIYDDVKAKADAQASAALADCLDTRKVQHNPNFDALPEGWDDAIVSETGLAKRQAERATAEALKWHKRGYNSVEIDHIHRVGLISDEAYALLVEWRKNPPTKEETKKEGVEALLVRAIKFLAHKKGVI